MYQGPARCRRADPHSPYTTPYWSTTVGGGAKLYVTTGAVTGPSYVINGNTYTDVGAALSAAAAGSGGGNLLVDASNNTWSSNATAPVAGIKNTVALGSGATANDRHNKFTPLRNASHAPRPSKGSIPHRTAPKA